MNWKRNSMSLAERSRMDPLENDCSPDCKAIDGIGQKAGLVLRCGTDQTEALMR